jgi:hypothetical protein
MISMRYYGKFVFMIGVVLLGVVSLYYIYSEQLNYPVIRSDGEGYYAYLPAIFIYHDISLRTLVAGPLYGDAPQGAAIWGDTTRYFIKYPVGEAILMMPFFWLGFVGAFIAHNGVNGYSPTFQFAAAFSGLVYTAIGLVLLWTVLQKHFKQNTILMVLTGILFGTNLFHYATYDAIFSHTYSFFLFALFLFIVERLYRKSKFLDFIALGLVGGLIVITRPINSIWLLFGIFFGINSREDVKERFKFWIFHKYKILFGIVALFGVVSIQLLYWRVITKSFFVYSYGSENFVFSQPEILNVLFSVRKGLFFWSPILLLVFPGLFFVKKMAKEYFLPILVFFPINIYIISSWYAWSYGGSFGQRPFVESLPMFAIVLCSLYEGVETISWKRVILFFIIAASGLSIWLMLKYWLGIIPFDGTTWELYIKTFFSLKRP